MPITVLKPTPVDSRYRRFLTLFSSAYDLSLSDGEMTVLEEFYWVSQGKLTSDARKKVAQKMGITAFNLNNHIGKLRKKKMIVRDKKNPEQPDKLIDALIIDIEPDKRNLHVVFNLQS
jgi:hypothetical protein